jgi:parallel beta-helix repeat protein
MNLLMIKICFIVTLIFSLPLTSLCAVVKTDTVWSGKVNISEDILIPESITLTILPGTVINIEPSDRTKTDPEYLSSLIEINVRGKLEIEGGQDSPVLFHIKNAKSSDKWAGIIIDGGTASIKSGVIKNAETGIYALKCSLVMKDSVIRNNRYGLVAQGEQTIVQVKNSRVTENDYGVFEFAGTKVKYINTVIEKNKKKDLYLYGSNKEEVAKTDIEKTKKGSIFTKSDRSCRRSSSDLIKNYSPQRKEVSKEYKDEVLLGDTIWRGRIEIDGLIRVPEKIRLIIVPGTIVEFKKKDTNGDGIGENGLLMQGVLIAKGTKENPIIFRSAERYRGRGDWDSINIMNSDGAQNLVEYCQIEDAYRGLHFHFSNVMVNESVLKNNYRAIQFQESRVEMRGNYIFNNKSGIKARDSEIVFKNNYIFNNVNGINFFRTGLSASNNKIMDNFNEGIKIREGTTIVRENLIDCNRFGLMINDLFYGKVIGNIISNNFETGISLKDSDNVDLRGNFIQGSGFNGINILSSGAVIKENYISENGERGIGIQSFAGTITDNSIVKNGLCAIENESESDISAPMNWLGTDHTAAKICDKEDERHRETVLYLPVKKEPVKFSWPVKTVLSNITWNNSIHIHDQVEVLSGASLTIAPGTKIFFSEGAGMKISNSRIIANGEKNKRIVLTSLEKDKEKYWDEIFLEHADGSVFSYCDFEYATWAVHSHFTNLKINNAGFRKNQGGMRFRSGPIEIANSLFTENRIGIRVFRANALIRKNAIFENETGIFVREKGGGLTIRKNNIYSNTRYNIRVGDFNFEDVDARENWWGTDSPVKTILDGRREPGVGKVIYEPYLRERQDIEQK